MLLRVLPAFMVAVLPNLMGALTIDMKYVIDHDLKALGSDHESPEAPQKYSGKGYANYGREHGRTAHGQDGNANQHDDQDWKRWNDDKKQAHLSEKSDDKAEERKAKWQDAKSWKKDKGDFFVQKASWDKEEGQLKAVSDRESKKEESERERKGGLNADRSHGDLGRRRSGGAKNYRQWSEQQYGKNHGSHGYQKEVEKEEEKPEPKWEKPEPKWQEPEPKWKQEEPKWQPERKWEKPEPKWQEPEPKWQHEEPKWKREQKWQEPEPKREEPKPKWSPKWEPEPEKKNPWRSQEEEKPEWKPSQGWRPVLPAYDAPTDSPHNINRFVKDIVPDVKEITRDVIPGYGGWQSTNNRPSYESARSRGIRRDKKALPAQHNKEHDHGHAH